MHWFIARIVHRLRHQRDPKRHHQAKDGKPAHHTSPSIFLSRSILVRFNLLLRSGHQELTSVTFRLSSDFARVTKVRSFSNVEVSPPSYFPSSGSAQLKALLGS